MKRFCALLTLALLAALPGAQAQDCRLLVADADPEGHGRYVKEAFQRTAEGYGLSAEVEVRPLLGDADLTDTAIAEGFNIVLPARKPITPSITEASARAWANGVAFVSPHGENGNVRYEVVPHVTAEGPLFIGGEDFRPGMEGSFGGNLELDVMTLRGQSLQSYAPAAGAAILCWVYQRATDAGTPRAVRWQEAREIMRELAGQYASIPKPDALDPGGNDLPEAASTLANWRAYRTTITRTERPDGTIRIQSEGGSSTLKYYKFLGNFPAGNGFSEVTVTNQGAGVIHLSSGLYNKTAVAPGETKTIVIRHSFHPMKRYRLAYRLWTAQPEDAIDAVFEPIVLDYRQPVLAPNYDAPRTDEYGEGMVVATRAGLLGTGELEAEERVYAQQQQDRLTQILEDRDSPLPVELGAFTGRVDGRAAVLEWQTLSETDNRGFYVEQKAGGGWEIVGTMIEGAGTSQEARRYTRRVEGLGYGRHVFRLRQVDRDGGERVFDEQRVELSVQMDGAYVLEGVYPMPVRDRATLAFAVQKPQAVTVALYNTLGQRVQVLHDGAVPGGETVTLALDADRLASGLYFVRLHGENFVVTEPVTLVR